MEERNILKSQTDITEVYAVELLKQEGVLKEGHFRLESGSHSSHHIDLPRLHHNPAIGWGLIRIISTSPAFLGNDSFETIVGANDDSKVLAHALAFSLCMEMDRRIQATAASLIVRKDQQHLDYNPADASVIKGKRVMIVCDILTSENKLVDAVELTKSYGGIIVGAFAIWNRARITRERLNIPTFKSLVNMDHPTWHNLDCPICQEGLIPLDSSFYPEPVAPLK